MKLRSHNLYLYEATLCIHSLWMYMFIWTSWCKHMEMCCASASEPSWVWLDNPDPQWGRQTGDEPGQRRRQRAASYTSGAAAPPAAPPAAPTHSDTGRLFGILMLCSVKGTEWIWLYSFKYCSPVTFYRICIINYQQFQLIYVSMMCVICMCGVYLNYFESAWDYTVCLHVCIICKMYVNLCACVKLNMRLK